MIFLVKLIVELCIKWNEWDETRTRQSVHIEQICASALFTGIALAWHPSFVGITRRNDLTIVLQFVSTVCIYA